MTAGRCRRSRPTSTSRRTTCFIEITTLNQKLVTKKNRKARRLQELHPELQVRVLYQRDYLHLLVKYGLEPPSQLADVAGAGEPEKLDLFPPPRPRPHASSPRPNRPEPLTDGLRTSPLDAEHRALGARMVEFGGWDMPIQYSGVLEEHRACRDDAVVFDVSHLGSVRVGGGGAFDLLQWALTNDLRRIEPGRAQYTHLLDPDDAHVVDDIIVWWVAPDEFLVMPNASNTGRIADALSGADAEPHAGAPVSMGDVTAERAVLAVQGPHARERLATRPSRGRGGAAVLGASRGVPRHRGLRRRDRLHR